MKTITISYADLDRCDLQKEMERHDEIRCELSAKQANALRSNWAKYHRYWKSRSVGPGSIKTAFWGAVWVLSQGFLDLRYRNLDELNRLYMEKGDLIEPVEFKEEDQSTVFAYLRKKGPRSTVH